MAFVALLALTSVGIASASCANGTCISEGAYLLQRHARREVTGRDFVEERDEVTSSTSKRGKRGAPWTEIELDAMRETFSTMFKNSQGQWESDLVEALHQQNLMDYPCILEIFDPNELTSCDHERASDAAKRVEIKSEGKATMISSGAIPSTSKFLRLGFHDCVRYKDGTGGCDGCLNFEGMFVMKNMDEREIGKKKKSDLPYDLIEGHSNNLAGTADILEAIYTDVNFGSQKKYLTQSLKDSGKSRADLWAFATLVAAEYFMKQNNARCDSNNPYHLYNEPSMNLHHSCKINPTRPFTFYSGRSDCPESDKPAPSERIREYETAKAEKGANPHASGKELATFMEQEFGFTGRETVALMGVHTAGSFTSINEMFRYTWSGRELAEDMLLNNIYYRMLAFKPLYLENDLEIIQELKAAGDPIPPPRELRWMLNARGITPSRGPVQWFSYTYPEEGSPFKYYAGEQVHMTMLNPDMGLYLDFDTTPGGFPIRNGEEGHCAPFDTTVTSNEPIVTRAQMDGCLQTFPAGDGKTLAEVVEEYADDQDGWWDDFTAALEKMTTNGYTDLQPHVLTTTTKGEFDPPLGADGTCDSDWCCGGYTDKKNEFCCAATCEGLCGGNSCDKAPGGKDACCKRQINNNGRVCNDKWDLVCTIPT